MVLVYSHPDSLRHATPEGHPEQVARMAAVERGLAGLRVTRRDCPAGADADILRCHPQSYLDRLAAAVPAEGAVATDPDTWLSPGSLDAARAAVGGACAAVDAVIGGGRAFVACRPPGHHALADATMGFCVFGTVAIAAKRAIAVHGLTRVAVVDFDVHHGNGTQALLWDEARVLFVTSQQMPLWPGSGAASEQGAHGQIVNLPLPPGSDGGHMRRVYQREVLPRLAEFAPEMLLISAGFDAHRADPLAQLEWEADDYAWLTGELLRVGGGRVVSVLEGGYDLAALAECVAAHVGVLAE
jgi:acetoin utilization deacetylase AcuC-like enzyme